jgi:hypothetical protein
MGRKSSISLEGRYLVGSDSYPSGLKECVVRVAVGERRTEPSWECHFKKLDPSRVRFDLEHAVAVEVTGRQPGARALAYSDGSLEHERKI